MDKTSQEKSRAAIVQKYEQNAFECFGLYGYHGMRYAEIEKQALDIEKRIEDSESKIREIEVLPDHHTVENKEKVKALKKDCQEYEARIKGVREFLKKQFETTAKYQEEGVRLLEQAEYFKAFSVKTPEEIEADKKKEAPAEPVVAGETKQD